MKPVVGFIDLLVGLHPAGAAVVVCAVFLVCAFGLAWLLAHVFILLAHVYILLAHVDILLFRKDHCGVTDAVNAIWMIGHHLKKQFKHACSSASSARVPPYLSRTSMHIPGPSFKHHNAFNHGRCCV